jgi:hypothetical protein
LSRVIGNNHPLNVLNVGAESGADVADFLGDSRNGLSTFYESLVASGVIDTVAKDTYNGSLVVFAPTDEAFVVARGNLGVSVEELMNHPEVLEVILLYHLGVWNESGVVDTFLSDDQKVVFVDGSNTTIVEDGFGELVNVVEEVELEDGVRVLVVDGVLFPSVPSQANDGQDLGTVANQTQITPNATSEVPEQVDVVPLDQYYVTFWQDLVAWSASVLQPQRENSWGSLLSRVFG